jgi:hypothetical protein
LLSNIEPPRSIWVLVSTPEELAEDGVVWLLDTFGLNVPAGEVVLENSEEAFFRVFDLLRTGYPRVDRLMDVVDVVFVSIVVVEVVAVVVTKGGDERS